MSHFYEKSRWVTDAKKYQELASIFHVMCWIIGIVGTIAAIIALVLGISHFEDGGWAAIIGAFVTAFQSLFIIIFGMMMKWLSRVLLANFEMSISETRHYLETAPENPQE